MSKFNSVQNLLQFQFRKFGRISHKFPDKNEFLEYADVFNNKYGTLISSTKLLADKGYDVLFDIDWQGTKQLSNYKNLNLIKIYLITHNKEELKKRLLKRDQNTSVEIKKRFNSFDEDIKHWNDYDYILINKNLEVCFKQIETIIKNYKKQEITSFQKSR